MGKSTTASLPAMLWPICGREKIRRDACNESAAELVPEACTDEDRQGRVQCSFCRELEHEEPSFCRKLAHEGERRRFFWYSMQFSFISPFLFRGGRSPTAAQFAS